MSKAVKQVCGDVNKISDEIENLNLEKTRQSVVNALKKLRSFEKNNEDTCREHIKFQLCSGVTYQYMHYFDKIAGLHKNRHFLDESKQRLKRALGLLKAKTKLKQNCGNADKQYNINISKQNKLFYSRAHYFLGLLYEKYEDDIYKAI